MNKASKIILGIVIILLIAAIAVEGFILIKNNNNSNEKIKNLENQILTLTQKKEETSNTKETSNTNNNNTVKTPNTEPTSEKINYNEYIGNWSDKNDNLFTINSIDNNSITFTWFIYRITNIRDITLPLKNNIAVFYYQGFDDLNYNSIKEDNEFYYRKASIQLREKDIIITIKNVTQEEVNSNTSLLKNFDGSVYVEEGQYIFSEKTK